MRSLFNFCLIMAQIFSLIWNPKAGRTAKFVKSIPDLQDFFRDRGAQLEVYYISEERHGRDIVRELEGRVDGFLIAGGDGTLHECMRGMKTFQTPVALLPLGTANVLAQEIQIPEKIVDAASLVFSGSTTMFDVGLANDAPFVLWCGVGLDAHIVHRVSKRLKQLFGPFAFEMTGFREIPFYTPQRLHVVVDGKKKKGYFAIVSNVSLYGGKLLFPEASFHDGLFDVMVVSDSSKLTFLRNYLGVSRRKPPKLSHVARLRGKSVEIISSGPSPFQVDGEPIGNTPVRITMSDKKLRVFVPR